MQATRALSSFEAHVVSLNCTVRLLGRLGLRNVGILVDSKCQSWWEERAQGQMLDSKHSLPFIYPEFASRDATNCGEKIFGRKYLY